ncbi:MAG: hypothetical protein ACI87W_002764 [Halieaceae bacterium]|jgi:hypothetical protein
MPEFAYVLTSLGYRDLYKTTKARTKIQVYVILSGSPENQTGKQVLEMLGNGNQGEN